MHDTFVRLKLNWSNIAAQLKAFDVGILNKLENSCCGSHDCREESLSATLNNHLALAVLALIAEFRTGGPLLWKYGPLFFGLKLVW